MAPSTDRQTFRQLVAAIAAKAKATLPTQVNGRIESAVKLVLAHDVVFHDDGTVEVGSASDPMKTYTLAGHACDCQDFAYGQAPGGWCQHKIAAGIAKRVQALLSQSAPVETSPMSAPAVPPALAPSPAPPRERSGMRLEAQVVIEGRPVKVAVWGPDDADVQARLQAVLQQHPVPAPASPQGQLSPQQHNAAAMHRPVSGFCPVHNLQMTWNEGKQGKRGWYSHRTADGWCKGR